MMLYTFIYTARAYILVGNNNDNNIIGDDDNNNIIITTTRVAVCTAISNPNLNARAHYALVTDNNYYYHTNRVNGIRGKYCVFIYRIHVYIIFHAYAVQ